MACKTLGRMNQLHNFVWLAEQALGLLMYLWPISFGLLLFMVATCISGFPFTAARFKRGHLLILLPFFLSFLLLVAATLLRHRGPTYDAPTFPVLLINIIFWLHVPISVAVVYYLKGYRWFAVSIQLLAFWVGAVVLFIAGMA